MEGPYESKTVLPVGATSMIDDYGWSDIALLGLACFFLVLGEIDAAMVCCVVVAINVAIGIVGDMRGEK